jgi:hypothetical protein
MPITTGRMSRGRRLRKCRGRLLNFSSFRRAADLAWVGTRCGCRPRGGVPLRRPEPEERPGPVEGFTMPP